MPPLPLEHHRPAVPAPGTQSRERDLELSIVVLLGMNSDSRSAQWVQSLEDPGPCTGATQLRTHIPTSTTCDPPRPPPYRHHRHTAVSPTLCGTLRSFTAQPWTSATWATLSGNPIARAASGRRPRASRAAPRPSWVSPNRRPPHAMLGTPMHAWYSPMHNNNNLVLPHRVTRPHPPGVALEATLV